jgi:hypothetical protein
MNGKGSGRRPTQISQEELARRWETTFGRNRDIKEPIATDPRCSECKKVKSEHSPAPWFYCYPPGLKSRAAGFPRFT